MWALIGLAILFGILLYPQYVVNKRLDTYDMSKVDTNKLGQDVVDGVPVVERRRRCVTGQYDKDE